MKFIERADHLLPFLIALTLAVTALQKFGKYGFKRLGWGGPASFFS